MIRVTRFSSSALLIARRSSSTRSSSSRLLSTNASASTVTSSEKNNTRLCYDRDTGIIWETSSSSSSASSATQRIKPLYQTIIGIEIHSQLSIPTKLFSSAPTRHNNNHNNNNNNNNNNDSIKANTNVHPYDLAYPGTLPSLSLPAVHASILSAAALNCTIHKSSRFERKHYFYPDLPSGYQITQQRWPLASDGCVTFMPYYNKQVSKGQNNKKKKNKRRRGGKSEDLENSGGDASQHDSDSQTAEFEPKPVQLRIDRIQIEQDTGKTTTHNITTTNNDNDGSSSSRTITKSHIDYNRAGCALIEIVSAPNLRSAHEAAGVVEKIRKLLKHVGSCDGKMEEGSLRCDLNVSIAPIDDDDDDDNDQLVSQLSPPSSSFHSREELPPNVGYRVEVKNLNSLRQIAAATEYEALRQSSLDRENTPTGQETRTFHVKPISDEYPLGGETYCIRAKGGAVDYRFMPEPDLPPLILDEETLGGGVSSSNNNMSLEEFVERNMPESPEEANARLMEDYGLSEDVANVITGDPPAIALFEETVKTARNELTSSSIIEKGEGSSSSSSSKMFDSIPTLSANWLCNDLFGLVKKNAAVVDDDESSLSLNNNPISVEYSTVDGERLGALVAMVANGTLTTSMAKKVLAIMFEQQQQQQDSLLHHPADIAKANGWRVISDPNELVELCNGVVHDPKNSSQLEQYKLGGKKVWKIEKFYAGKVMAASKGNADPERMKEALALVLDKLNS